MPAKRKNPSDTSHDVATTGTVEQEESIDENPSAKSSGLKNSLHGNAFQLKLLILFLIRGIKAKYQFQLGTEIPRMGGKFDDLIFKYEVQVDDEPMTEKVPAKRYRYLQAKHKQNEREEKITAADLLKDNDGEFSLPKYFRSYHNDVINGINKCPYDNIQDCIICTNIGFEDELKLKEKGIELLRVDDKDDILTFDMVSHAKTPALYKLKKTKILCDEMTEWSDVHHLAKTLLGYVIDNKKLTISSPIFKSYYFALVNEEVIDIKDGKLCATFFEGNSRFREILSEVTFIHYWKKLKFKYDDTKKIRVDNKKELDQFEGISLEKLLPKYQQNKTKNKNKTQKMEMDFGIFMEFYDELISEQIMKSKAKTFAPKFIQGKDLSEIGSKFRGKLRNAVFIHFWKDLAFTLGETFGRQIISSTPDETKSLNDSFDIKKEIDDFLDKLVFAVHTPNEVELDDILKSEGGDRYSLHESDFKSDFILRNMFDWFKKKESKFMKSEEGIEILENSKKKMKSLRVTAVSIDYQKQLKEVCEFNTESIQEMAEKLTQILTSTNQIECIITQLPNLTAGKVIAALKELRRRLNQDCTTAKVYAPTLYFQRRDSYLMTSLTRLRKDRLKLEKTVKSEHSHHLLIVVCDTDESLDKNDQFPLSLTQEGINIKKRIIIIRQSGGVGGIIDDLKFTSLSKKSKAVLLSKEITFQGKLQTVGALILKERDKTIGDITQNVMVQDVIDLNSMEELMKKDKIVIPSFSSTRFEKSLYIKRRLISPFPLDEDFWSEVVKELGNEYSLDKIQSKCTISPQGEIEWRSVDNKEKSRIWEKINIVLEKRNLLAKSQFHSISEDNLSIHQQTTSIPRVVIVSGVAGTGKSSILSHFYEEIKDNNLDHWAIMINLTDHSEAFFKLKSESLDNFSAVDFLIHLSVVNNSAFARSLLRHRLETGDRIEIMLDGFDESHYQEIVVKMIDAIKQTKLNRLFVTTRSHMASRLQFKLSQLTFSLENFSQQDQINYLTSLWKVDLEEDIVSRLQQFAKDVVDRVSKTLNDQNRDFIGIPLQCRILADCFQSEVQEAARQGSTFESLFKIINELKFNLASLYRLLMDKKREIYRQEKVKAQDHNLLVISHIDEDMKNLNVYLRTLAIETIVSTKEHVDTLLGGQKQLLIQSDTEQIKKQEKRTDHSVRFGLLDTNAKGQVQFLHRTYPEFLMAEYLYNGFLLDETCHNKLLEFESIRKLIINKIFAKVQYDGVQVFVDSMLKEIVDENKEWHANVVHGKLPERFFQFSEVLFSQFLRQIRKPYTKKHPNALLFSLTNKKEKVFKFFCDCLDATFDQSEVLRAMTISFLSDFSTENYIFTLKDFCQSSEVFQRVVGYYSSAHANTAVEEFQDGTTHVEIFVKKIFHGLSVSNLEDSYWNAKDQQNMIECLLDFMNNHQKAVEYLFQPWKEYYMEPLLAMLIFNENYENHLKKFLKILSQTKTYSDESRLSSFIKNVCSSYMRKNRKGKRIQTVLDILTKEQNSLAIKIHGLVFSIEPEIFTSNFRTCHEENDIFCEKTEDIVLLNFCLERDLFRITPLHRAAFNNETEVIEKILLTIQKNSTHGADTVLKGKAKQVVNVMCCDENGFTPFYVAAARGHEIVYHRMLVFLKEFNEEQKTFETFETNLTATNGFIFHALSDAMESENLEMFQVILNAVKNILGQNCLLNLLKSKSRENRSQNRYHDLDYWSETIFGVACRYKKLFQSLAKIVARKDTGEDYQDWNNLVFHLLDTENFNRYTLKYVNAKILKGMQSAENDSNNWMKRLLDISLSNGFKVLSNRVIKNLSEEQFQDFVTMLTSKISPDVCSDWCKILQDYDLWWGNRLNENHEIFKFLKRVSENFGENFVYNLVIHDDGHVTIQSKALANLLSSNLSKERQEEAKQYWKTNPSTKIDNTFFTPTSETFWLNQKRKSINYFEDIVWFYLDNGSDAQLKDFIKAMTSLRNTGKKKRSMWSYFLENDAASNKVIKYVSENVGIFGVDAAETLLFHVVDEDAGRYLNVEWWKKDIDELLSHLPEVVQEGIRQYIQEHASGLIEEILKNPSWLITYDRSSTLLYKKLNTLTFLVNYSNSNQLQKFIQHIKVLRRDSTQRRSIWYGIFLPEFDDDFKKMIGKFLKGVSDKLGSSEVKRLLLHVDDGGEDKIPFIFSFALFGEEQIMETMLSYLNVNDRESVQRKINKFLDKTFNIPPKRKKTSKELS